MPVVRLLLLAVALVLTAQNACYADWPEIVHNPAWTTGSWSCAASACHGGTKLGERVGGEIELWRNADPHARANGTIEGPAFANILARLAIIDAEGLEAKPAGSGSRIKHVREGQHARLNECMGCHNPADVPTSWTREQLSADDLSSDGLAMSCETCHGPAKHWIADHYRRGFNRRAAMQQGFHDLKDPLVRGRTCAQCHVGDGERDMNHDMIAAGHPPLRFELASYEQALPRHWNDRRQRTLTRDYEKKLWLAGQVASFDGGLALTESRLRRSVGVLALAGRPIAPWPEFAEHHCSSCHHPLRSPTTSGAVFEPRSFALGSGGWSAGMLEQLSDAAGPTNGIALLRQQLAESARLDAAGREKLADQVHAARLAFLSHASDEPPPRIVWKPVDLATMTYDQHLQAYAMLTAKAQSRLDEQAKTRIADPAAFAVLGDLATIKALLLPRRRDSDPPVEMPSRERIGELLGTAAEKLNEGVGSP